MSIDLAKMPKLGFGLMRLPEEEGKINLSRVCEMVDEYMKNGFNYFDTAYVYHSGKSECAVKEAIVARYPRESFMLATKLPAWEMKSEACADRILNEQLERTGAGYFDFYLLHSVEEGNNYDAYVKYNCFEWGKKKKEEGVIKHFGFSFHGSPELLENILSNHPELEFVQIQLNYADWDNQIVRSGELYEVARKHNVPIIVMEPIKGGTLANPTEEIKEVLKSVSPNETPASMALRFVASLDGIMTILSGMSTEEQMAQNVKTFKEFKALSNEEKNAIDKVMEIMKRTPLIGCTACRYCVDGCPSSVPIPDIFKAFNTVKLYNEQFRPQMFYNTAVQNKGKASDCIACGQCEGVCPQHLGIIGLLKDAAAQFDVEHPLS